MSKKIALIALNPIVDFFLQGENFSFGKKIFAKDSFIAGGGFAINVARGLSKLRQPFRLYAITGGDIGLLLRSKLHKENIPFSFIENKWETRATTIFVVGNKQKMLVTPSPKIETSTLKKLINDYYSEISEYDYVLIGGSIPENSINYINLNLLRPLIKQGVKVIIDSRGFFAKLAHKNIPYIIRYNKESSANLAQDVKSNTNQCLLAASKLYKCGTSLIIYYTNKYCYAIYGDHIMRYPNYTQFNKRIYGRGDAFIAGLISSLVDKHNFDNAVRFSIACGASFTHDFPLGGISPNLIPAYFDKIHYDSKRRIM